jgi:prevent-host-death family protein
MSIFPCGHRPHQKLPYRMVSSRERLPLALGATRPPYFDCFVGGSEDSYNSHMKKASVSETKNNLSKLLLAVKKGETILIQERSKIVAKIVPYLDSEVRDLVRDGIASPPQEPPDAETFLNRTGPRLPAGISASMAVSAEREEGR